MSPFQGSVAQRPIHVAGYQNRTPTLETEKHPIEQGHNPRRNARARHDPRVKYLGFTSRQWPFLFVLVGNWIFALAFFLGAKLVWHWVSVGMVHSRR